MAQITKVNRPPKPQRSAPWGRAAAVFACLCAPLPGCGGSETTSGGGGGGGGGGVVVEPPVTSVACALTGCEIAKLALTASMPSGTATYTGRASVTTETAPGTLATTNADLGLVADFAASQLTLSLTNIQNTAGQVAGSATGSGTISGNGLNATYAGAISGTMSGNFRGTNAAALMGEITLAGGGGTGGDAFGQFFANKQ